MFPFGIVADVLHQLCLSHPDTPLSHHFARWPSMSIAMVWCDSALSGKPTMHLFCIIGVYLILHLLLTSYDSAAPDNVYAHLTNASINKHSATFESEKDVVGKGSKWTLTRFFQYLTEKGVNCSALWDRYELDTSRSFNLAFSSDLSLIVTVSSIKDVVVLTMLSVVGEVQPNPACFEMFGFGTVDLP